MSRVKSTIQKSQKDSKSTIPKKNEKSKGDTKMMYKGKLNPSKIEQDDSIESPECVYTHLPASKLTEILSRFGIEDHKTFAKIFTELREYEDYSVLNDPEPPKKDKKSSKNKIPEMEHQTKPEFVEKIVQALFFIPKKGRYEYKRIRLAPSNIKAAGTGAYAVDDIPKGAKGVYKGVSRDEESVNMFYAWTTKSFDPETGETDEFDEELYYIDAFDIETSNWTRYVNCGPTKRSNNMESDQFFDKFFYIAIKDIEAGEELLIDYGEAYRSDNLGMTGKY